MKAYTSSSSSRAMSVARDALESSTTSPAWSGGIAGSVGLWGFEVMKLLREQIPAEQIGGVRPLHVRHLVRGVDGRFRVGIALAVGRHSVQADSDAPPRLAAAEVNVRDVLRVGLKAADDHVDRHTPLLDDQGGRAGGGGVDPGELEAEPAR